MKIVIDVHDDLKPDKAVEVAGRVMATALERLKSQKNGSGLYRPDGVAIGKFMIYLEGGRV